MTLRLYPGNGYRSPNSQIISIAPSINGVKYFALDPPTPTVRLGDYFIDIRITSLPSTPPGTYSTSFLLTPIVDYPAQSNTTILNYFFAPPGLVITLAAGQATIPAPSFTSLRVPILGVSLPVSINLGGYAPLDSQMSI